MSSNEKQKPFSRLASKATVFCVLLQPFLFLVMVLNTNEAPGAPRRPLKKAVSAQSTAPQMPGFCPGAPNPDGLMTIQEMTSKADEWKRLAKDSYCVYHQYAASKIGTALTGITADNLPDREVGKLLLLRAKSYAGYRKLKLNSLPGVNGDYAGTHGQNRELTGCMVAFDLLIHSLEEIAKEKTAECEVVRNLRGPNCQNQTACPLDANANYQNYRSARDGTITGLQETGTVMRDVIKALDLGVAQYQGAGTVFTSAARQPATGPNPALAWPKLGATATTPIPATSLNPLGISAANSGITDGQNQYKALLAEIRPIAAKLDSERTRAIQQRTLEDRNGLGGPPPPGNGPPGGPGASRNPGGAPDPRKQGEGPSPLSALAQGLGAMGPLLGALMKKGDGAQGQNPGAVTAAAPGGPNMSENPGGKEGASGPPPLQGSDKSGAPPTEKNQAGPNSSGDNPYSNVKDRGGDGGGGHSAGQGPAGAAVSSAPPPSGGGGGGSNGGSTHPTDRLPAADPGSPFSGDLLGGGAGGGGGGGGSFSNSGANDSIKSILKDMEGSMGMPTGLDQPGNPLAAGDSPLGAADPNDPLAGGAASWDANELKMQGANVSALSPDVSLFMRHTRFIRQAQLRGNLINGVPKEI